MTDACPDSGLLEHYLQGTQTGDDDDLDAHVRDCLKCQSRLDRLAAAADLPLGQTAPETLAPPDAPFLRQVLAFKVAHLSAAEDHPARSKGPLPMIPGYEVLGELGRGGMGVVYKACHRILRRLVAIKMMPAELFATDADRARFRSEAEAIAHLRHSNIVEIYEFGETAGRPYFVLEYAEGGTLKQLAGGEPQCPREAAEIVELIAQAVQAAHDRQIIHRDLKPGNVLMCQPHRPHGHAPSAGSPRGRHEIGPSASHPGSQNKLRSFIPKVSDFGLARRLDSADPITRELAGSPAYMAPEQVPDGEFQSGCSPSVAVDVYALGVILYELLTGRPPFLGTDWMTVLLQVRRLTPLPPRQLAPGVPADLETICLKCLRKEPEHRYASAGHLADDLRRFLDGRPIVARPVGPLERLAKWARQRPVLAGALTVFIGLVIVTVATLATILVLIHKQQQLERQLLANQRELLEQADTRLYFSSITQASFLWRDSDLARARLTLERCEPSRRQWEWRYLRALCDDGLLALSAPPGHAVWALAADGELIAALASPDGPSRSKAPAMALVWDARSGIEKARWTAPHSSVDGKIVFTPDGRIFTLGESLAEKPEQSRCVVEWPRPQAGLPNAPEPLRTFAIGSIYALSNDCGTLAAPRGDGLAVWDLATGGPALTLGSSTGPWSTLAISGDGKVVASADPKNVTIWRLPEVAPRFTWKADSVSSLALSPHGQRTGCCEAGSHFQHRDSATGKIVNTTSLFTSKPGPLTWSANGRFVLLNRLDGARVFDLTFNQRSTLSGPRGEQPATVTALGVGPDENSAVTGESNGLIHLWDLLLGQPRGQDTAVYRAHSGEVTCAKFIWNGRCMVSGGKDGWVRVWDITRGQRSHYLRENAKSIPVAWDGSGRFVAAVSGERLRWHDVVSGTAIDVCKFPSPPRLAAAATGGRTLVTADSRGPAITLWQAPESPQPRSSATALRRLTGLQSDAAALALSANGSVAAATGGVVGKPTELCVWDTRDGRVLWSEPSLHDAVAGIAVSEDGALIAVGSEARAVRLIQTNGDKQPVELGGAPDGDCQHLAFSGDGRYLAAVGRRGRIFLWSLPARQLVWSARLPEALVGCTFSPDGERPVVLGESGDAILLDARTGLEVLRLAVPNDVNGTKFVSGNRPLFSADGRRLMSPLPAGGMHIWDGPPDLKAARDERRNAVDGKARGISK